MKEFHLFIFNKNNNNRCGFTVCTHLLKLGYNDLRGSSVLQFIRSVVIKAS